MQPSTRADTTPVEDVLANDAWLDWNGSTWGLEPHRVKYGTDHTLEGVLYTDRRGRVRMPPLNPYLPFQFTSTGPQRPERVSRQWIEVADMLAEDLASRRIVGKIILPPEIEDARPFHWSGLVAETRYTYTTDLPYSMQSASQAVRKNVNKAEREGFVFEESRDADGIVACLQSTANRKGFAYSLDVSALARLFDVLDTSRCRGHVVRDASGTVVSAGVRLLTAGGKAIDWVQGTDFGALKRGAAQLMYKGALEDLANGAATSFDYGGANIRQVTAAKSAWGMRLTPYTTLGDFDLRHLVRAVKGSAARLSRR